MGGAGSAEPGWGVEQPNNSSHAAVQTITRSSSDVRKLVRIWPFIPMQGYPEETKFIVRMILSLFALCMGFEVIYNVQSKAIYVY